MKIGFVTEALPYLPSRGGFRLYGGNLIRHLSRRHHIDLLSLTRDDDGQHLDWPRPYCASVRAIPVQVASLPLRAANLLSAYFWGRPLHYRTQLKGLLQEGVRSQNWDVLHIEGGFVGGLLAAELPIAKVLSVHDSWTLRCDEMLKCSQSFREKLYFAMLKYHQPRYQRLVYPRFERCVVVANRDAAAVRETVPACKVEMIPYGTDTEYFQPVHVDKQEATLVFHSHLGYAPNIEAALEFANDIFPLIRREVPDVRFHLVGADPVPPIRALASRPSVQISANLPDLRPAVCSARVYVCAIRHGTGLKSKMLEAMGMRMPIVCYPGSTVGIDCIPGKHLLVARNAQEFSAHVLDLLRHPQRAEEMAQAGRDLVVEQYSWESRARSFEELYQQVIEERKEPAGISGRHGRSRQATIANSREKMK